MLSYPHRVSFWPLALLAASLPACDFSIDADLTKNPAIDAGSTPGEDSGIVEPCTGAACEPDGGDAGKVSCIDRGDCPPSDPDDGNVDCVDGGCPVSCTTDADCKSNLYCSKAESICRSNCSATLGCVGPVATGIGSEMLNDARGVYWSTWSSGNDLAGNPVPDGAVWFWNLQDEPVRVTSGLRYPTLLFLADDRVFFLDEALYRSALAPDSAPELVAPAVTAAWVTEDFLFWSAQSQSTAELWRKPRTVEGPAERLATGAHDGWLGGNQVVVFHAEKRGPGIQNAYLVKDQLSDLTVHQDLLGPWYGNFAGKKLIANDSTIYVADGEVGAATMRLDLSKPGESSNLSPDLGSLVKFFAQGGWVYWSTWDSQFEKLVYGRSHGDLLAPTEEMLRREVVREAVPGGSNWNTFTVHGNQMVHWVAEEGRMFTQTMAPLPCSDVLACPDTQTCSASMTCN